MQRRRVLQMLASSSLLPCFPAFARIENVAAMDAVFLDEMQRRGCLYFLEQASEANGQVLDRASAANTDGKRDSSHNMASIAATGFGLTALCIADKRGYFPRTKIVERVRKTLLFHRDKLENHHGFFSHFNDVDSGDAYQGSEVSSIDTSLLLCGVLTARAYFASDPEIVKIATAIYNRVDWPWMLNGGTTFAMGLRGGKFLPSRWNHYCELMMLNLLALGSQTHPVDAATWDAWARPKISFGGFEYISAADPLFVHQYSHAWFDFRRKKDKYADYFANSILATRAHEAWCVSLGKPYSADYWGVTASDSVSGYTAWGGPPTHGRVDGSVVPCAAAGSLHFLPDDCLRTLKSLRDKYGKYAWGRYGFCDAFHPDAQWYDSDVLGINLGIGVLMAENLRTNFVWETFAKNREVGIAFDLAGFKSF